MAPARRVGWKNSDEIRLYRAIKEVEDRCIRGGVAVGSGMEAIARDLGTLFSGGAIGGLSDGQLLGRFVERREDDAFEVIVRRHGPMVWGVCRRVLRDRHDAEDAFQATFFVLARKAATVMPREKLGNWLYGVASQTARKARATRARRRAREGRVADVPEPMAVPDDPRDVRAESLDRELSRLPGKYHLPIILCDLEGMSHKEAARQLGWPVGTVSSRLSRARKLLARRLSRPGMTLTVGSLAILLARDAASAGMPTRSVGPTARAAIRFAADGVATAGVVSADVAALMEGVLKLMRFGKLKVVAVAALSVAMLSFASIGMSHRARAAAGPPPAKRDEKTARRPTERIPGWRVRFDKPHRGIVTLDSNGTRVTFYADAVMVEPDGTTSIRGSLPSAPRKMLGQIEELARSCEARGTDAQVEIAFHVDGFDGLFASEMTIRVAVEKDGLVRVEGRPKPAKPE